MIVRSLILLLEDDMSLLRLRVRELTTFAKIVCGVLHTYNVNFYILNAWIYKKTYITGKIEIVLLQRLRLFSFHCALHTHIILRNSADSWRISYRPVFFISFKNSINVTETVFHILVCKILMKCVGLENRKRKLVNRHLTTFSPEKYTYTFSWMPKIANLKSERKLSLLYYPTTENPKVVSRWRSFFLHPTQVMKMYKTVQYK